MQVSWRTVERSPSARSQCVCVAWRERQTHRQTDRLTDQWWEGLSCWPLAVRVAATTAGIHYIKASPDVLWLDSFWITRTDWQIVRGMPCYGHWVVNTYLNVVLWTRTGMLSFFNCVASTYKCCIWDINCKSELHPGYDGWGGSRLKWCLFQTSHSYTPVLCSGHCPGDDKVIVWIWQVTVTLTGTSVLRLYNNHSINWLKISGRVYKVSLSLSWKISQSVAVCLFDQLAMCVRVCFNVNIF